MMNGPLAPLARAMQDHGVLVFPLPSADMQPGLLLDSKYRVIDQLVDLKDDTGRTFFASPITLGPLVNADFVIDEVHIKSGAGGSLGLDYLKIASVKAAAQSAKEVTIQLGPIKLKRVQCGTNALGGPAFLEDADYCKLATKNIKWGPFKMFSEMMQARKVGWPSLRSLNIAGTLVYAESINFCFGSTVGVSVEAKVAPVQALDVQAGFDVSVSKDGTVTWSNGDSMPIGFVPVRYAYRPKDKCFILISG